MRIIKFIISFSITLVLLYLLNNSWEIHGSRIPPLGKFLDPFHGFWQNIEPQKSTVPDELTIPGLKDKVTLVFDSLMIPHIFASNDEDLYLAQGYVTAMHRLWQMEFQTHAAAGRLTEILGRGTDDRILEYDRGQRRLGMTYAANVAFEAMRNNPIANQTAEKYAEGINHYIHSLRYKDLPFEYKLLDYAPEDWTPLKSALLLKSMAQTLNMSDKDLEMTNALKLFGKETVDLLYPDREPPIDPIVEKPGSWKFDPVTLDAVPPALPDELISLNKLPPSNPTTGSNNWAVAGSKTATGSPILCGDPHLTLSLPSIWYVIQLNGPDINTMGASLPGAPGVIIGFNDSIAWSVTNAQRDLVDWFKITFQDKKKDKYLLDDEWADTKKVVEEFTVRGGAVLYDTVLYTHFGPVTYDENYRSKSQLQNFAFRWISHDHSQEIIAFHKLNRAKNHQDYMEALNNYGAPAQNFVFASVSGDVAMRIQGKYPVRRKDEGKFLLNGSKRSNGWQAFIPNSQNVMDKNPERGFVSSANQYPVDATYPYYVTGSSFEAYRNRRINSVLRESNAITISDMMALQNDNYNLKAAESLPLFLSYIDSTRFNENEKRAWQALTSWDYFNNIESEGASYYEAWWDNLMPLVWDEMQNKTVTLRYPTTFNTIKLIAEKPDLPFFDMQSTPEKETAREVVAKAFSLGVDDIEKWKASQNEKPNGVPWADFKDSYVGHLLRLAPLSIPVRAGGNHDIVNAHSRTHGPSWRMVVSLEKSGIKTWATYPGGQSGNPGSKHYNDMLDRWVNGKYFALRFMHDQASAKPYSYHSTTLNPALK
ncbi:MAG: penicillin acylase family protein [Cyclobacteriaceae bacterium]|nr:penicillin acylase family protein [Cyclobacteriaceae bacterium]